VVSDSETGCPIPNGLTALPLLSYAPIPYTGCWDAIPFALGGPTGLSVPMAEFLDSCIHMHVNRLLPLDESGAEQTLYDHLGRWYESRLARERPRA